MILGLCDAYETVDRQTVK